MKYLEDFIYTNKADFFPQLNYRFVHMIGKNGGKYFENWPTQHTEELFEHGFYIDLSNITTRFCFKKF